MNKYLLILSILLLAPAWSSAQEDFPNVSFGGRLQLDYTFFDNDKFDFDDGGETRRGRLFARGSLAEDWQFKVQYDFAPNDPELKDGYVQYTGLQNSRVWIGNFKQPSSLEQLTSANNLTFTERALSNSLVEGRRIGVGFQKWSEQTTWMVSVYGDEANGLVEGNGVAGRFVYHPQLGDGQVLHLGLSAAWNEVDGDSIRLRARPETHQDPHRIVNTGTITDVDNTTRIGLEAAYVNSRFSAQAELVEFDISRRSTSDLSFSGYYAYASYFLTDDRRVYRNNDGTFDKVSPSSTAGAWEIALRFSNLDLNHTGVPGGEADLITFGLNYYATSNLRFTANYVVADTDSNAGDDDPGAFQLRMQITF